MAALDTSAADFMYKKLYKGGLDKECLLRGKQMMQWATHDTDFTTHKGIEIPVPYVNPQGIGATNADAATVATPSQGKSFTVPQRHITAYGQLDGVVVRNAINGSNTSAFADTMEKEVDGTTEALGQELNQRMYGASDGIRSYIATTTQNASAVINTTTLYFASAEEAQLYEPGMRLQFINPANGAVRSGGTGYVVVQSVDPIAGTAVLTATLNAAVTSVALGDGIIRWGMNTKDLDGIKGWCPITVASSGDSFLGVDRYVYRTRLAGIYVDKSNSPIRTGLLSALGTAKGQIGKHFERKAPWFINPKNMTQLKQTVEASRVIEGTMADQYGIGIDKVEIMGDTFIEDEHCPVDEAIRVGKGAWTRGSCGDQPYIDDSDGQKFVYNRATGYLDFCLAHDGNTYSYKPYNIMRVKLPSVAA